MVLEIHLKYTVNNTQSEIALRLYHIWRLIVLYFHVLNICLF